MNLPRCFPRTALMAALAALLFPFAIHSFRAYGCPGQADSPATQLGKTRSLAESQHEIVLLLIKKKDFEQALVEANKIFDMKWPADQESTLLKELLLLSDKFLRAEQAAVGIRLLETNLKSFRIPASQASIWKEKGYLYKGMGDSDRALECFRQAQRLEK
jgi:tetratricopeptide (TPR) repeat protein